jgi:prevent-host-death family protein
MERVPVSRLREKLTVFLKKVRNGQSITITSRGYDLAKLVPLEDRMEKSRKTLKQLAKTAVIGDVLSPVDEQWEAMK